ncbi:CBS domain-containing protein [Haloarcula nitratireducens]|uniref:CBS domain-containing protein n=1 Tax=Haloarcula nitratireducens TaxID=2487749 RepID=A0AAW4P9N1_9EURY|nr:CBS domain-containing protein [Halomicroarcula nitratireducens]MBX0294446.1 CBS domain-containing protein [Halomicroarcula nitratireducens]
MLVRDLMSTEVVTVPADATLDDAVGRLLDEGVGSAVVVDGGDPVGIVTESDALRAARETSKPLAEVGIRAVGHRPVVTTTPSTAIPTVARRMADEGVKKVPVLNGVDLVGIVTLTDIVWHLSDLRSETSRFEAARKAWDPR